MDFFSRKLLNSRRVKFSTKIYKIMYVGLFAFINPRFSFRFLVSLVSHEHSFIIYCGSILLQIDKSEKCQTSHRPGHLVVIHSMILIRFKTWWLTNIASSCAADASFCQQITGKSARLVVVQVAKWQSIQWLNGMECIILPIDKREKCQGNHCRGRLMAKH